MIPTKGYAIAKEGADFTPFDFVRREPGPTDVLIEILYCGICHSDLHQVKNEWGKSIYPMVPGHEIVGKVIKMGEKVTRFKMGDSVGVGCLVDSCRVCSSCTENHEQYCEKGYTPTYNGMIKDSQTTTYGGYSKFIVVDEAFTLKIPNNLELSKVAPLLCAGITTYSPLKHWKVEKGQKVGVVGLGGLGHMAIKLAHAMGAYTVVMTHSEHKVASALELGADEVIRTFDPEAFKNHSQSFDLILNTVSADIDLNPIINCLKRDGTLVLLGIPEHALSIRSHPLIVKRRSVSGSLVGGMKETQELLDFCSLHNVTAECETIPIQKIDDAFERLARGDVHYRFVIDLKTLV